MISSASLTNYGFSLLYGFILHVNKTKNCEINVAIGMKRTGLQDV